MTDSTVLIKIPEADLLDVLGANGEHWLKGAWTAGDKLCLHAAIRRCQPIAGDAHLIEQVAEWQGWGPVWNDRDSTTWEMVRARLGRVEVTDRNLLATFGWQWVDVVELVRRAAVLSDDEATRMRAAHKRRNRLDAAWDALHRAARSACWVAAWSAATAAAGPVAGDAAGAAAAALAVREVIGTTFTRRHYDALTYAWRSVIGPVHLDDAPLTDVRQNKTGSSR